MKSFNEFIAESRIKDLYFDSYTAAIDHALEHARKKYDLDDEELAQIIGFNSQRPKSGKTTSVHIPLYKNGKQVKQHLHIQVFNRDTNRNTFELNYYIS